jgi:hypothetical protein
LDELTKKLDKLSESQIHSTPSTQITESANPQIYATGAQGDKSQTKEFIQVPQKFLSKLMPTFEFLGEENSGIFDLHIFDINTRYSTYRDKKQSLKLIISDIKYDTFLKNFRSIPRDVYIINETKTFPFRSFYVNPQKPDTLVRLVLEYDTQTILLEIPKTRFPTFKALILKK